MKTTNATLTISAGRTVEGMWISAATARRLSRRKFAGQARVVGYSCEHGEVFYPTPRNSARKVRAIQALAVSSAFASLALTD